MKFYMVMCHRGHCGIGHSTEIKFAIAANNLLEACDKAKRMPSVKHTRMAIYGKEITETEYNEYRKVSAYERFNQQSAKRIVGIEVYDSYVKPMLTRSYVLYS